MQGLQGRGADSHKRGAEAKEADAPRGRQVLEQRVGIPAVVSMALLDPEPVRESDSAAEEERAREGDGPGWGEEQEVGC